MVFCIGIFACMYTNGVSIHLSIQEEKCCVKQKERYKHREKILQWSGESSGLAS